MELSYFRNGIPKIVHINFSKMSYIAELYLIYFCFKVHIQIILNSNFLE